MLQRLAGRSAAARRWTIQQDWPQRGVTEAGAPVVGRRNNADTEFTEFDPQQHGNRYSQYKEGVMNPDGREFECFRTNEVYEVFMSSNSVSALRLGSLIHPGVCFSTAQPPGNVEEPEKISTPAVLFYPTETSRNCFI